MKWCRSCILPDTRPGIVLNSEGDCEACVNIGKKTEEIDWVQRENEFLQLVESVKSDDRGYDCLVPVSGGKDSTWQIIKCLEVNLKPLALTWKTPGRTTIGQCNLDNLVSLGVDHIDWQVNPAVEKKFMLKSFKKYGSTAIPMHMAIHSMPLKIAVNMKIPLVIFGENAAFEYGSGGDDSLTGYSLDSNWRKKFGVTHGTTARDWIHEDLSEKDMTPYFGPTDQELEDQNIKAIFLGHYFKWDVQESLKVASNHGFITGNEARTGIYDFADIDDDFISIHHWMKWYKFGITRSFDNLSLEIRNGRINREDAINIITELGEEKPVKDINALCQYLDIKEVEFMQIANKHRNQDIWIKKNDVWMIRDFLLSNWDWN